MPDLADILAGLTPAGQERYLNGPAYPPPAGVVPNFDRPDNKNTLARGVFATGLVVASIFLLLRAYSRIFLIKKASLEDVLILAGFGLFGAYSWCCYKLVNMTGIYVHQWNVRLTEMPDLLYFIYVGTTIYGSCAMVLKAAILYGWARIFVPRGTKNGFYWTCHILLWVNIIFYGSAKIAINLQCFPHAKIWNKAIPGGHCLDEKRLIVTVTVINSISDLVILILPQRVVWSLHMTLSKKIITSLTFAVGIFCFIASLFRVVSAVRYLSSNDLVYGISDVAFWGHVEITTMIMVACVPSIPKAFKSGGIHTCLSTLKTWATSTRSTALSVNRGTIRGPNNDTSHPYGDIEEQPLSTLTSDGRVAYPPESHWPRGNYQGILRTTHVTTNMDDDRSDSINTSHHHLQHPWVQQG